MAVSKRLRYEILRRDNHACRYCGATAPGVKLNVDHVIPQALGGSDKPINLVTSCAECNAGKTSSMPNAMPVADVDQETFRQAADAKWPGRTTHDPETGMPTSWSFREVELALVEEAWHSAWCAVAPEGPPFNDWEQFADQLKQLADRRVFIGNMLAASVMAGSRLSTDLTWGIPSRSNHLQPNTDDFELGCDVICAWETAWGQVEGGQPTQRDSTLFIEEMASAIQSGHERSDLLHAAVCAGRARSFYLPDHLPEIQIAGGEN